MRKHFSTAKDSLLDLITMTKFLYKFEQTDIQSLLEEIQNQVNNRI